MLLYRTLEHGGKSTLTAEQLADDIYPSVVYFADNFKLNVAAPGDCRAARFRSDGSVAGKTNGIAGAGDGSIGHSRGNQNKSELSGVAGALYG